MYPSAHVLCILGPLNDLRYAVTLLASSITADGCTGRGPPSTPLHMFCAPWDPSMTLGMQSHRLALASQLTVVQGGVLHVPLCTCSAHPGTPQ